MSSSWGLACSGVAVAALAWVTGPVPHGTTAVVQTVPDPLVAAPVEVSSPTPPPSPSPAPTPTPSPTRKPKPPAPPAPSTPASNAPGILEVIVVDETGAPADVSYELFLFEGELHDGSDLLGGVTEHGYFAFDVVTPRRYVVYSPGCDGERHTADDLDAAVVVAPGVTTTVEIPDKPCPPEPTPTETPSVAPSETPSATPSATATPSP